jgi:hypothetical protein
MAESGQTTPFFAGQNARNPGDPPPGKRRLHDSERGLVISRINASRFFDLRACAQVEQMLTKWWLGDCTVDFWLAGFIFFKT